MMREHYAQRPRKPNDAYIPHNRGARRARQVEPRCLGERLVGVQRQVEHAHVCPLLAEHGHLLGDALAAALLQTVDEAVYGRRGCRSERFPGRVLPAPFMAD